MSLRTSDQRWASRLEWFTIAWNVLEAVVAVGAGVAAGSIALIGFGFDSSIESLSAVVVLWQLSGPQDEDRTSRALKLIAITFFVLAAYIVFESVRDLLSSSEPETSPVGIVLALASVIVMPTLGIAKRRLAEKMVAQSLPQTPRRPSCVRGCRSRFLPASS